MREWWNMKSLFNCIKWYLKWENSGMKWERKKNHISVQAANQIYARTLCTYRREEFTEDSEIHEDAWEGGRENEQREGKGRGTCLLNKEKEERRKKRKKSDDKIEKKIEIKWIKIN